MNRYRSPLIVPSVSLVVLFLALGSGCAKNQNPWGDPQTGLILTYRMPEDRTLRYAVAFDQTHTLSAMGQERNFSNHRTIEFSAAPAASPDGNLHLTVTIDALNLAMDTPQGEHSMEAKKLEGKSFELTLSPQGRVVDSGEAAQITYFLGGAGEQGIDNDFRDLFPELPDGPVKVGDTWTHRGSIPGKSFNAETSLELESVNTLAGFETVDGMECAKITSSITGNLVTTGESAPGTAVSGGTASGGGVWYFAYEEGLFVKGSSTVRASTEIAMGEPGRPPVPATEETKIEVHLVDRGKRVAG